MAWSITLNGHTYTDADMAKYGYITKLPAMLADAVLELAAKAALATTNGAAQVALAQTQATNAAASAAAAAADKATVAADKAMTSGYKADALGSADAAAAAAASAAASAAALTATSSTAITPSLAAKVLTTQAGKDFQAGTFVMVVSASNPDVWMFGPVTSYTSTTLTFTPDVAGDAVSKSDWTIAGRVGARGVQGPSGVAQGGMTYMPANGVMTSNDTVYARAPASPTALTLPDLTGTSTFGVVNAFPDASLPTNITMTSADGWVISALAASAVLVPLDTSTPHGVWYDADYEPPTLASWTGEDVMATVKLSATVAVVLYKYTDPWVVAVNLTTGAVGTPVKVFTGACASGGGSSGLFAESATAFAVFCTEASATQGVVGAGTVNPATLAITLGTVQGLGSSVQTSDIAQLSAGLYVFHQTATNSLRAASVLGTTVTLGTAVAVGATTENVVDHVRVSKVTATKALVAYVVSNVLNARVVSVSGTTLTLEIAAAAATAVSNTSQPMRLLKPYVEGTSYLCVTKHTTATTGNFYGITVSGTTTTIGTVASQASNLPDSKRHNDFYVPLTDRFARYDASTYLFSHLASGVFAVTISGSTVTVGSVGGQAAVSTLCTALDDGSVWQCVNSTSDYLVRLSVSGGTVSAATTVNLTALSDPVYLISSTLSNRAIKKSGTWYQWSIEYGNNASFSTALTETKWLADSHSTNIVIVGDVE